MLKTNTFLPNISYLFYSKHPNRFPLPTTASMVLQDTERQPEITVMRNLRYHSLYGRYYEQYQTY